MGDIFRLRIEDDDGTSERENVAPRVLSNFCQCEGSHAGSVGCFHFWTPEFQAARESLPTNHTSSFWPDGAFSNRRPFLVLKTHLALKVRSPTFSWNISMIATSPGEEEEIKWAASILYSSIGGRMS
jgi:hypothetical protein